jgi:hypothetical protein
MMSSPKPKSKNWLASGTGSNRLQARNRYVVHIYTSSIGGGHNRTRETTSQLWSSYDVPHELRQFGGAQCSTAVNSGTHSGIASNSISLTITHSEDQAIDKAREEEEGEDEPSFPDAYTRLWIMRWRKSRRRRTSLLALMLIETPTLFRFHCDEKRAQCPMEERGLPHATVRATRREKALSAGSNIKER